jgi:hypothetical protein
MKSILILLLATGLHGSVQAQFDAKNDPFITKSLSAAAIKNVKVRTSGGSISVSGVDAAQARLEVFVRPSNGKDNLSKEEIQKRLDEDYELTITTSDNLLTAIAKTKDRNVNWKRALSISFKVYVPQAVSTDLATSGGSIQLADLTGTQEFSTSGGSLRMKQLSGKIHGRTSGGSITVTDSKDIIDLSTSGGGITAENCNGQLTLSTSGGSLHLSGLKGNIKASTSGGSVHGSGIGGELYAHTSGGSVHLTDLSGSVDASTSGGNMHVTLSELGKYVTIKNSGGNVDLTLPGNKGLNLKLSGDRIKTDKLNNFSGSIEDDEIDGTLNGGGIPVTVRAGSGRISLWLK